MACIPKGFAVFTPEGDSNDSPKGPQAHPAFLGRCTQKASGAYAMRYADVNALLCAAAWADTLQMAGIGRLPP